MLTVYSGPSPEFRSRWG